MPINWVDVFLRTEDSQCASHNNTKRIYCWLKPVILSGHFPEVKSGQSL